MRGVILDGRSVAVRDDLPQPVLAAGDALIRVLRAGVCKTDLELVKGYMGYAGILGHEFVGVVVDGSAEWIGKRVVGEINCPCGRCEYCAAGLGNHCPTRTVLGIVGRDGCFAEYITLPVSNLHHVPDSVSSDQAVFVEPLAAAFEILQQVNIAADNRVVVLGDGRLGLLCAMALQTVNPEVLLVGKHESKLAIAADAGIATTKLEAFAPAKQWDVVVEATGSPSGFQLAMELTRPRGTLVLKSTVAAESGMNLAPLVIDEITVVGSRCGPFDKALAALAEGRIDPTPLIAERFPLAEGVAAMKAAVGELKVLLDVVAE